MDGLFDNRHNALALVLERRSAATEVRTAFLLTLAVIVVTMGALLTLDAFGLAPLPMIEFPVQNMGLLG
jgi:hypothetical protein